MTIPPTIERWHRIALERRADELTDILAEDAVFESPVVHTPQEGKAIVAAYLRGALEVLNTQHFRYGEEWFSGASGGSTDASLRDAAHHEGAGSAVLEFYSEIDGITINGIDIITWNERGLITHFKVMVRPLKAINMLHQKMGEYLVKSGAAKSK
ncbi:MAG: nuclear transport factor 2 family protein [Hyphomonadaceae bacterium]